jgi:hypothetical protein
MKQSSVWLYITATLSLCVSAGLSHAATVTYGTMTAFDAATTSQTQVTFNSLLTCTAPCFENASQVAGGTSTNSLNVSGINFGAVRNVVGIRFGAFSGQHEGIVSGGEVNRLIDGFCGEGLPAIHLAHADLSGGKQRPEHHRGSVC